MKRYTIEFNHKVIKEYDYIKEAEYYFPSIVKSYEGGNGQVFIYDNRDDKYVKSVKV